MLQWKRHHGKQVHGTHFGIPKLNEKAKCHRNLDCLYILEPGQWLFEHTCLGFSVGFCSQVPKEAIHSFQHRLVLNVTGSWGECLYPILSWGGWLPQELRREEKAPWAFALLLQLSVLSARGTEHWTLLIYTTLSDWHPPQWDASMFLKACQEAVYSESGKILAKHNCFTGCSNGRQEKHLIEGAG